MRVAADMGADRHQRAIVFPGQGSQAVGMGRELAGAGAGDVFRQVDDALGEHLSRLMFEGPVEELMLTRNAQPALMTVGIAALRLLETRTGTPIAGLAGVVAGHSLGEYTALAAAGSIDIADTARLLRLRGEAMQEAVPVGEGAMAALLGAELETARDIAGQVSERGVCNIANDNAPGQVVISGARGAIELALDLARDKGVRRAIMLPVSAPFHCSLMQPAAERMAEALAGITIRPPELPLVANVLAAPVEPHADAIRARLVEQVTQMVRWRESVLWMSGRGVAGIIELGPGNVLTGLHRRIDRSLAASSAATPDAVEELAAGITTREDP